MTKSVYPQIYRGIWSLTQTVTRGQELPILNSLEKSQYLSPEQLQDLQLRKLIKLLEYAYVNVPYYRDRMQKIGMMPNDIKSIDDFRKMPVLTRKELQDNVSSLQSREQRIGKYINHTGGSTGIPVTFYQDRVFHDHYKASIIRTRRWYGFDRGDKVVYLWGAERDIPHWSISERLQLLIKRQRWLNAFRMSDEQIGSFMSALRDWQPKFIIGYASALHVVAKYMLQHDVRDVHPMAIESSAEKLWDYQRVDIESAFSAPVVDVYGSREMSPIASQCMERGGLHIMAETRLVEVTDDLGIPAKNEDVGNIVVTDLTNYTMPLIRYANGDMGSWQSGSCSCGRSLPMLKQIEGRTSDLIRTKFGTTIHGEFFTHLFYGKAVVQFQVRQVSIDKLVILIHPSGDFSNEVLSEIRQKIDDFSEGTFDIDFRIVDEIPLTSTGKYRFTISDLPKGSL